MTLELGGSGLSWMQGFLYEMVDVSWEMHKATNRHWIGSEPAARLRRH